MSKQYYQISETGYPVISSIELDGFTAYEVGKEPKELLEAIQAQEVKEAQEAKVQEAKAYLSNTDYKMLPNYVVKLEEDINDIITKRNTAREFIRSQG